MASEPGSYEYVGQELELFARAQRWKAYVRDSLAPFIRGNVLEVGAGLGSTTRSLRPTSDGTWTCIEPDPELRAQLEAQLNTRPLANAPRVLGGTLADLPTSERFDTILYIDVLEHIENDSAETVRAAERLQPGGRLIILCPAHNYLFSPFDRAIGHYRRYDRGMMRRLATPGCALERCFYLDCAGMTLSLGNRLLLREGQPTPGQIRFWDTYVVPLSRLLDRLTFHAVGKTVVGVWRRTGPNPGPLPVSAS